MPMSTQTLAEAAALLSGVLVDTIQLYTVAEPETTGIHVTRELTPVGDPVASLVQTTVLENATESRVNSTYSVKFAQGTVVEPGMAIEVITATREPSLQGKKLLLDKVSQNGVAVIRKAVASDFEAVNQEGKEGL